MRRENLILWVLATLGLGLSIGALFGLRDDPACVRYEFTAEDMNHTPVLALRPRGWTRGPGAIVVHGYPGSKEMMQAIARPLAQAGIAVYCPDLPGSGNSAEKYRSEEMLPALRDFYRFLLAKEYVQPGRVALVGHSLGGSLATRLALETEDIRATVSISNPPVRLLPTRPRNFLSIVGDKDVPGLRDTTVEMMIKATGGAVAHSEQEAGSMTEGTARRLLIVDGATHLGVIYNQTTIRGIQEWLGRNFGIERLPEPSPWRLKLGVLYAGIFLMFIPLSALLGAVRQAREMLSFDHRADWRNNLICLLAALLAILILRFWSPLGFVPIEAGAYLASFFLLVGILRIVLTRVTQTPDPSLNAFDPAPSILFGVVAFLFLYLTFGAATHRNWLYMLEGAGRLRWFAVVVLGISPFFIEDEKIARSMQEDSSPMVSYFYSMAGKVCLLAVLLLAMVFPFFRAPRFLLTVSLPFLLLFFAIFQLCSVILYHFTRRVLTTAVFNTLVFAWLLTAAFVQV
jgi:pimeloyl-ACP methyl ester carboxylesterase